MQAVYGLYSDPSRAQRAFDSLRAAGVEEHGIAVVSSVPWEEYEFARRDRRTPMAWLAALGGLLGGVSGYLLAGLTQKAYPIPTGGMAINVPWTNGIITYELTMLGAILVTLITLLISAHIPDWTPRVYDPAVADGCILVGVVNPRHDSRVEIERSLREAGADSIKEANVTNRWRI
ncbi:MAG: DUF3341 domain-containing protein [Acidobacteriia bacterium]|nr:DUF3341 domain-containing protein [Terriglobia bacterium]